MHLPTRARPFLTGAFLAAALIPAASAQAGAPQDVCDTRLDRLEAQFYDMADRRGYEAASEWWQARWQAYHTSCVV
ncbi:MAG: hypothetical protein ABWZ67_06435 [Solirubrobacteraceae bacterium]